MINFLKNDKGFNLVQMMVALGLTGLIATVAFRQVYNTQRQVNSFKNKSELDLLVDIVQQKLSQKSVCEENFLEKNVSRNNIEEFNYIDYNDQTRVIIRDENLYVRNKYKLKNIRTEAAGQQFILISLDFIKFDPLTILEDPINTQSPGGGMGETGITQTTDNDYIPEPEILEENFITKTFKVNANSVEGVITSCHSELNSNSTSSSQTFTEVASTVCGGSGVLVNGEECVFTNFDQASSGCPDGEVLGAITLDSTTGYYTAACSDGLSYPICPHGRIRSVQADGTIECLDNSELISSQSATFDAGSNCRVKLNDSSKLELECTPGATTYKWVVMAQPPVCFEDTSNRCYEVFIIQCQDSSDLPRDYRDCSGVSLPSIPAGMNASATPYISPPTCNIPARSCRYWDDGGSACSGTGMCLSEDTGQDTGGGGGGCFIAGTEITLFDGSRKNIENVTLEDILMGTAGEPVRVNRLITLDHSGYKYSINGSRHFVTGAHPIKTFEGWKAFEPEKAKKENPQLEIGQLKVGDYIFTEFGVEELSHTDKLKNNEKVYNFTVDGKHEYMADGYQVHNKCDTLSCQAPATTDTCAYQGIGLTSDQCQCANGTRYRCCQDNINASDSRHCVQQLN